VVTGDFFSAHMVDTVHFCTYMVVTHLEYFAYGYCIPHLLPMRFMLISQGTNLVDDDPFLGYMVEEDLFNTHNVDTDPFCAYMVDAQLEWCVYGRCTSIPCVLAYGPDQSAMVRIWPGVTNTSRTLVLTFKRIFDVLYCYCF